MKKLLSYALSLFPVFLPLIVLSIPMLYYLPSLAARLLLVLVFLIPLLLIELSTKKKYAQKMKAALLVLFFIVPSLVFLQPNSINLPPYLEGAALSETRFLAQKYTEQGNLVFNTAHSYFFQVPLLMHFISVICGISTVYVTFIMISIYIILSGLVGLYVYKVTSSVAAKINSGVSSSIPPILAFLLMSSITITLIVGYRSISSLILLLLMCHLFSKGFERRSNSITILLLVLGIMLGSPTAIMIMIPFFLLFSVFKKRLTAIVYALIPLSFMIYTGYSYTVSIGRYTKFALEGFLDFLRQIMQGRFPERVFPWERTTLPTLEDTYFASATYLSLLALALISTSILTIIWTKERHKTERGNKNALLKAGTVSLWFALAIMSMSYIGASVKPEVPFSDIRTIVVFFVISILPFMFTSQKLLLRISAQRILLILVIVLMILSSFRIVYEAYPKSIYDPINVVEDERVDLRSKYYVGNFLKSFYTNGRVGLDYKTYLATYAYHLDADYSTEIISESSLPLADTIVFDMNGLRFNSLYIPQELYAEAYNLTLTQNLIYNSGNIIIVQK